MASLKSSGDIIGDIAKELVKLGEDVENQLGQEMLDEGAQIIEYNWCKAIKKHGHVDTGDMVNSIGAAKKTKGRNFREIYPQGKDHKGQRNAEKAFVLHYGRSGRNGSRFVDEAEADSDSECANMMQEKLNEYLNKKGL